MPLRFSPVRATGFMVDVYETDADNNNVILAELNLFTACQGPPPENAQDISDDELFDIYGESIGEPSPSTPKAKAGRVSRKRKVPQSPKSPGR